MVHLTLQTMAVREQLGHIGPPAFLDQLVAGNTPSRPVDPPDVRGYVELALRGGFPSVLEQNRSLAESWLESYVDQIITRDAVSLAGVRDPSRLRRYVSAYAMSSAGTVSEQSLIEVSGLDRKTADAYERLLTDLFVVEPLPGWTSNRLQRLARGPKRYFVEPSLVGAVLRADADTVMRDVDLLGRLIDTVVVAQLRAEREVSSSRPVLSHVRERQARHEIDVLAEVRGARMT